MEKLAVFFLRKFPKLKVILKFIYQALFALVNIRSPKHISKFKFKPVDPKISETFFGYYDKTPENKSGTYLLYHSIIARNNISIFIKKIQDLNSKTCISSKAFNWQQGTKAQWINENEVIFNNFENGKYFSQIVNITRNDDRRINFPIYDCFKDNYALSLNFERLSLTDAPYGYNSIVTNVKLEDNEKDGIFFIDLITGKHRLMISISDVINLHYSETMKNAKHTFNHIMINPEGEHFIFIHRWYKNKIRYDSLVLSDMSGKNISILADEGMVSHCTWKDKENIVCFMRYHTCGDTFYLINIREKTISLFSDKLKNIGDGHPSFFGDKMLFDSYPDKYRYQKLYIFDTQNKCLEKLGKFYSPFKYSGANRCDLHPRWSRDGEKIYFDSVHTGKRTLYELNLRPT